MTELFIPEIDCDALEIAGLVFLSGPADSSSYNLVERAIIAYLIVVHNRGKAGLGTDNPPFVDLTAAVNSLGPGARTSD